MQACSGQRHHTERKHVRKPSVDKLKRERDDSTGSSRFSPKMGQQAEDPNSRGYHREMRLESWKHPSVACSTSRFAVRRASNLPLERSQFYFFFLLPVNRIFLSPSFIHVPKLHHSFDNCLLSDYYVLSTILVTGDTAVIETH